MPGAAQSGRLPSSGRVDAELNQIAPASFIDSLREGNPPSGTPFGAISAHSAAMKLRHVILSFAFVAVLFTYLGFRVGVQSEKNAAAKAAALSLDHQFIQAAKLGNISQMHCLLKLGANINATQQVSGFTAL